MFYVYVFQSVKDKGLYTGFAKDLEKRLLKHKNGSVQSTKNRRPLRLVYYEACISKKDAMKREIYLKTAWGKRYLKNRMKDYFAGKVPVR